MHYSFAGGLRKIQAAEFYTSLCVLLLCSFTQFSDVTLCDSFHHISRTWRR